MPIPKLTANDLPVELEPVVESILEVDRLFWLDPANKNLVQFERDLVPGEERPMQVPSGLDADSRPFTKVIVQRWGRTFVVQGRPVLMIEDNAPRKKIAKKREHEKFTVLDFRLLIGKSAKKKTESTTLTDEEKAKQRAAEHERQARMRQEKELKRARARMKSRVELIEQEASESHVG